MTAKLSDAQTVISYVVVVRLPTDVYKGYGPWTSANYYRVRISTSSFTDYIEIGAKYNEMEV